MTENNQQHSEIPFGDYCYTYDKNEDGTKTYRCCPHWERTDNGAKCNVINEEHYDKCMIHLVWDQVKECGINKEKGYKRNPEGPLPKHLENKVITKEDFTCPCGKTTELTVYRSPQ